MEGVITSGFEAHNQPACNIHLCIA